MEEETKKVRKSLREKNEILFLGLMLLLFCAAAGLVLGLSYELTKDTIAEKKEAVSLRAYEKVIPAGDTKDMIPLEVPEVYADTLVELYKIEGSGYVFKLLGKGYQGDPIEIVMGISSLENAISGVVVVSHSETAGLGANITKNAFLNQFVGKNVRENIIVVKGGAVEDHEIDAVSGATKSTRGVVDAVNYACVFYCINLMEEEHGNE